MADDPEFDDPNELVEIAYSVETPDDSRNLYRRWASTYDEDFVDASGYVYHDNVVHAFLDAGGAAGGVIADVGSGTGVVGVALGNLGVGNIDGLDISPEMIEVAHAKQTVHGTPAYRNLIEADLTVGVPVEDDTYHGIISTGVFTHGHLGPDALGEIVRIAAPTALCAIGINEHFYEEHRFDGWFADAAKSGKINVPELISVQIYEEMGGEHGGTRAVVAIFTVNA